jgi:hypothetical protein
LGARHHLLEGFGLFVLAAASGGALTIDNHHPLLFPGFYRFLKMIMKNCHIEALKSF